MEAHDCPAVSDPQDGNEVCRWKSAQHLKVALKSNFRLENFVQKYIEHTNDIAESHVIGDGTSGVTEPFKALSFDVWVKLL